MGAKTVFVGMTGYGVGEVESPRASIRVEVRSWNSKGLDISVRGGFLLPEWEAVVREEVHRSGVQRGSVRVDVFVRPRQMDYTVIINYGLWRSLQRELSNIGVKGALSMADVMAVPGLVSTSVKNPSQIVPDLKKALKKALRELHSFRQKEGLRMERVVRRLISQAGGLFSRIARRISSLDRQGFFLQDQESGYKRKDVHEELKRLKMNIDMFLIEMKKTGAKGKRLDFISQEIMREANTMLAKIADAKVAKYALELRMVVDRIREVVQNVE